MDAEQELLDQVAVKLALGYAAGRYSYEFGDGVANGLWMALINGLDRPGAYDGPSPNILVEVYNAFDSGEYQLGDEDPVKVRTDPMIADIIAKL